MQATGELRMTEQSLDIPEIERLQDEIAEAQGFSIESHLHQIFGLCQKCNRKAKASLARKARKKTRATGSKA